MPPAGTEARERIEKKKLPWSKSLNGRLGLGVVLLGVSLVVTVVFSHFAFDFVRTEVVASSHLDKGRTSYRMLDLVQQLQADPEGARREQLKINIRELIEQTDRILDVLVNGDPALGIPGSTNPAILEELEKTRAYWISDVKPIVEQVLASGGGSHQMNQLADTIRAFSSRMAASLEMMQMEAASRVERARYLQYALSLVALGLLFITFVYVRGVTRRTKQLAIVADMIADGNLGVRAPADGEDEIALLGVSFNQMTEKLAGMIINERTARERLEEMLSTVNETSQQLSVAATGIQEVMRLHAKGMDHQSKAVTKTVANVGQILENADKAAELSQKVSSKAGQAADVSREGREAVEETTAAVSDARKNSEELRNVIRILSERVQSISDIVKDVNLVADRTNLLALNAAIEASRAGEHGKGFSVVASEIRTLAGKSIESTDRAKSILEEIGAANTRALEATEEGVSKAEYALRMIEKTGGTIRMLERIISESAQQAAEITASANRQRGDIAEVREAMSHIDEASQQNLAATMTAEQTADSLAELGARLRKVVSGQAA